MFEARQWAQAHSDGSFEEILQTDQNNFEGYLTEKEGARRHIGWRSSDKRFLETALRGEREKRGHQCTVACGPVQESAGPSTQRRFPHTVRETS